MHHHREHSRGNSGPGFSTASASSSDRLGHAVMATIAYGIFRLAIVILYSICYYQKLQYGSLGINGLNFPRTSNYVLPATLLLGGSCTSEGLCAAQLRAFDRSVDIILLLLSPVMVGRVSEFHLRGAVNSHMPVFVDCEFLCSARATPLNIWGFGALFSVRVGLPADNTAENLKYRRTVLTVNWTCEILPLSTQHESSGWGSLVEISTRRDVSPIKIKCGRLLAPKEIHSTFITRISNGGHSTNIGQKGGWGRISTHSMNSAGGLVVVLEINSQNVPGPCI